MVDMALNGSGIRDTARVLGVSPMTVMSTLKKNGSAIQVMLTSDLCYSWPEPNLGEGRLEQAR
jgi:hypothetical protein